VPATLEKELSAAEAAFHQVMAEDVTAFNRTMEGKAPPIADAVPGTREHP
jgi:hypothetical protein